MLDHFVYSEVLRCFRELSSKTEKFNARTKQKISELNN